MGEEDFTANLALSGIGCKRKAPVGDGDGFANICVFRASEGTWYRQNSSNGAFITFQFGQNGDKPTQSAFRY